MCSTNQSHCQYGGDTPSVQTIVCITDLSPHQYGGGCAVRMSLIISTDEDVQYRTTKLLRGLLMIVIIRENDFLQRMPL